MSHATKYDRCLSPIQSTQLLGQMNNEQWRRLFFCKFRDYYLRQNVKKREFEQMYLFMIDTKVLDISRLDLIWNVVQVMREAASEMPNAAGSCILVVMHNSNLILILYLLLPVLDAQYQYLSILVVVQTSNLMLLSLPSSAQRQRTEHTWKEGRSLSLS